MKNNQERKLLSLTISLIAIMVVTSCTKKRGAELPEDMKADIYAISEFGTPSATSAFSASREDTEAASSDNSVQALNTETTAKLSSDEVNVPDRMKFMFDRLPMIGQTVKDFKITFSVDKNTLTAYKVAESANDLTELEKSIAITARQAQLLTEVSKASGVELKSLLTQQKSASSESDKIKAGASQGALLVPMFKYNIVGYGVLQKNKNDLKEDTSILSLKGTDFKNATHIQISSLSDAREVIGLKAGQTKTMNELFVASKLDNQVSTAGDLASRLKIGLKFIDQNSKVLTKVDSGSLLVFEITTLDKLSESQQRLLANNSANGTIKRCSDADVATAVASKDINCVIVMTATVQLEHVKPKLALTDSTGTTSSDVELEEVSASESVGLVQIRQQTPAVQVEILNNLLDPNSTLVLADLNGEFFFRRTLEDAASSFLGRTGTSGDMSLVKFELEDERIVVRNQMSLVQYTGQGAKDKEEMMSIPVRYFRAIRETANGTKLAIPKWVETTKEKAEVAAIDWTRNTVPDASSPLAFYDMGSCFRAESSQKVTATDMRLATDGVLNLSIASSYTVDTSCAAIKDVNSAYWAASAQFNFNVQERISFIKHENKANTDTQFSMNISHMAQAAFNFGVFTLADKVTNNGTLTNRDGSEKYMPMIHDFRNGRVIKWYLGGINESAATNPERRKLLVEAAQQVVDEWNASFRISFKGTDLDRATDYIQLIVEEPGQETGHLGDLDKNYIWFNEIPADNGLLGVAQPAANPKSGVIESANVIVYTGNTFQQTEILLKNTKIARQYEKMIESIKKQAIEAAAKEEAEAVVSPADLAAKEAEAKAAAEGQQVGAEAQKVKNNIKLQEKLLKQTLKSLDLDEKTLRAALKQLDVKTSTNTAALGLPAISKDMFKGTKKGQKINYPVNSDTFTLKLTELAMDKSLKRNPLELEFRMNDIMLTHAGLSELTKSALNKRQAKLSFAMKFDRTQQNRPGCFYHSRPEIEDSALNADPDPKKNLMINFKMAVMSTLSHELGHAFGLMHNFTGSTDVANYEFADQKDEDKKTHRNYSSIMDYISDIEQHYAGPGPYDVHAIRAAYTGLVPLNPEILKNQKTIDNFKANKINIVNGHLISITDAARILGKASLVHFTKDTVNETGLLEYYAQCHDMMVGTDIMCARFDLGGTPQEIVTNKIADYTRSYANRYYVYDRINFGWNEKVGVILRNVQLFEEIRGFLDQTLMAAIYGSGRGEQADQAHLSNLVEATISGYQFFHELVRIPDADGVSLVDVNKRFIPVKYSYKVLKLDAEGQPVIGADGKPETEEKKDIKILEARSVYDKMLTKDKIDTLGIGYDKMFAMNYLLTASQMSGTDDSQMNMISYTDFEQFFLGVKDPSESLTIQTTIDIITNNLTSGFYTPVGELMNIDLPVEVNRNLADNTAIAAVIGMNQAKWSSYDKFAETLLVGRSYVKQAPQDRINVVRMGQDRKLSDTVVYHAAQNAMGSNSIIMQAARSEVLVGSKADLTPNFKALAEADKLVKGPIAEIKAKACELNPETGEPLNLEACLAAQAKTDDEYAAENPALKKAKAKADVEAKKIVNKFRQLNAKEVIMPKDLDKADSKVNFAAQVEIMREQMFTQLGLIESVLGLLQSTPVDQLDATIQMILATLQQVSQENEQLAVLPVMAVAQMYMTDSTAELKVKLQDGQSEISGAQISGIMMNAKKLTESQSKLTDVIDKLSIYTRLIDLDHAATN
ncbi:MAG: zinc-dependent metalloprotease [Bdellovibrionota bacterium]